MGETVEITKLRTNYKLRYNYLKKLSDFIKSLPKDHYQIKVDPVQYPDGTVQEDWYRLVTEGSIGKVISFIKDNNIPFKFTNLTKEEVEELRSKFLDRQKSLTKLLKMKVENIDVTGVDFSFMKQQPYIYQKQAVVFFDSANGNAILGDQPGVGKTASAMAYAAKNKFKTLVVCPASLKLNWRNEILNFTNENPFVYKWKPNKKSGKTNFKKEDSLFHIINYESIETYAKYNVSHKCTNAFKCGWTEISLKKKYKACPNCASKVKSRNQDMVFSADKDGLNIDPNDYDLLILDEAHYIKNSKISRTKIIKGMFKKVPHKLLLTGTAIKNRPYEFYNLLNLIDPLTWKNEHFFGVRYCAGEETNFGWNYDGASNLEELYERIAPYFLRRLKSDVLKFLPPKTFSTIPIEMTPEELREYKGIENTLIDETQETDDAMTHLSRIQKLKFSTSTVKLKRAIEFIQDIVDGDEKVVVFSQYVSIAEQIAEHFSGKSVLFTGKKNMNEKQDAVDKFMKDDSVKVFAGTIGAAGVGITLTSSSIALFIDLPWTPADYEQACDRIHRASSTAEKIQIINLICQDTIDEDIYSLLNEKSKIISKVLDGTEYVDKAQIKDASIFKDIVSLVLNKKK